MTEAQPVVQHVVEGIPIWTIILGIIGLLANLVIGLIAWGISGKLGDLKDAIGNLTKADHDLSTDIRRLERDHSERMAAIERELSDHKLEASRLYTTNENFVRTSTTIFAKLDGMKDEIISHVHQLCQQVNKRIDDKAACAHSAGNGCKVPD